MRLSGILSRSPAPDFRQVDRFLFNNKGGNIAGQSGQRIDLKDVTVTYEYRCSICEDVITFVSKGVLSCVFISNNLISIDCVLSCDCGTSVPVWFLIESINDITGQNPEIRILDRKEKLTKNVSIIEKNEYTEFLDKAERAHRDGLGAGSMVYLRMIFESITLQTAKATKSKQVRTMSIPGIS